MEPALLDILTLEGAKLRTVIHDVIEGFEIKRIEVSVDASPKAWIVKYALGKKESGTRCFVDNVEADKFWDEKYSLFQRLRSEVQKRLAKEELDSRQVSHGVLLAVGDRGMVKCDNCKETFNAFDQIKHSKNKAKLEIARDVNHRWNCLVEKVVKKEVNLVDYVRENQEIAYLFLRDDGPTAAVSDSETVQCPRCDRFLQEFTSWSLAPEAEALPELTLEQFKALEIPEKAALKFGGSPEKIKADNTVFLDFLNFLRAELPTQP
jgi:hypothetical protein